MTTLDCSIPRPSVADLQAQIKTELSLRILGGAPVLPMSNEDVLAFVMAGAVNLMHGYVSQGLKESDPQSMCCDNLVTYAARRGIYLQGSDRARGLVTISGTPDSVIPGTIRFVDSASNEYKLDPSYITNPTEIGAGGTAQLTIVASGGGERYNQSGGGTLTVSTTIPGIDITATISDAGLVGGTEDESCDELRARVIALMGQGALSTNASWFIDQTLKWPGVTRACTDECEQCCQTGLTIYPFFDGAYPDGVPPVSVIDAMNEWMFGPARTHGEGLAPIGVVGSYGLAVPTIMTLTLRCLTGCAPNAAEQIEAAVNEVIRNETCVGSRVCLAHITEAVLGALDEGCVASVEIGFDASLFHRNDAFAYLACAHYLKLGGVAIT